MSKVKWGNLGDWACKFYSWLPMTLYRQQYKMPLYSITKDNMLLALATNFCNSKYLVHSGTGAMGEKGMNYCGKLWWKNTTILLRIIIAEEPWSYHCQLHLKKKKKVLFPWADTAGTCTSIEGPAGPDLVLQLIKSLVRSVPIAASPWHWSSQRTEEFSCRFISF